MSAKTTIADREALRRAIEAQGVTLFTLQQFDEMWADLKDAEDAMYKLTARGVCTCPYGCLVHTP